MHRQSAAAGWSLVVTTDRPGRARWDGAKWRRSIKWGIDCAALLLASYAFVDGVLYVIRPKKTETLSGKLGKFKNLVADELESFQEGLRRNTTTRSRP
jgi:hypothetical protein